MRTPSEGLAREELLVITPFPAAAFRSIGAVWVLIDLLVMGLLWSLASSFQFQIANLVATLWFAVLAAKAMLLIGWWFLGEGPTAKRVAGVWLFSPLLLPFLIGSISEPQILGGLLCSLVFAIPGVFIVGLPYVLLMSSDFHLARDVLPVAEKHSQFTVRQLMLVTLIAAVVMGALRATNEAKMQYAVYGLMLPLLAWGYPMAATLGLLQRRSYPGLLYAAGATLFLLALPFCTLTAHGAADLFLFVVAYIVCFSLHIMLLRRLGFLLIRGHRTLHRVWRYDTGIVFLEPQDPGVVFVEQGKGTP